MQAEHPSVILPQAKLDLWVLAQRMHTREAVHNCPEVTVEDFPPPSEKPN